MFTRAISFCVNLTALLIIQVLSLSYLLLSRSRIMLAAKSLKQITSIFISFEVKYILSLKFSSRICLSYHSCICQGFIRRFFKGHKLSM